MKINNVDNLIKNIDNNILKSLFFLDNYNIYISVIFILFLYNTCIFKNINNLVSDYYQYSFVRIIVLLLILYVSRKSSLIALFLAISFVISLCFKSVMENFITSPIPNSNDIINHINDEDEDEDEDQNVNDFNDNNNDNENNNDNDNDDENNNDNNNVNNEYFYNSNEECISTFKDSCYTQGYSNINNYSPL